MVNATPPDGHQAGPVDHRRAAEQLLSRVGKMNDADRGTPRETSMLNEAGVHALLATTDLDTAERRELDKLRRQDAELRGILPTEPMPEYGLPNQIAHDQGWYGAWDLVREVLAKP